MHTCKSTTASKPGMLFLLSLIMVCISCCATTAFSQQNSSPAVALKPFGKVPGTGVTQLTYDEALSNPVLACQDTNYVVLSYEIAFLPKGGQYRGPFKQSSSRLPGSILDVIKQYKTSGVEKTRVFFDNIKVSPETGQ